MGEMMKIFTENKKQYTEIVETLINSIKDEVIRLYTIINRSLYNNQKTNVSLKDMSRDVREVFNINRIVMDKKLLQRLLPYLIKEEYEDILPFIDFTNVVFANIDVRFINFEGTNVDIDPQLVKDKSFYKTNLRGIMMAGKNFVGVNVEYVNLENTYAYFNPQQLNPSSLKGTNIRGLYLSDQNFDNIDLNETIMDDNIDVPLVGKYIKQIVNKKTLLGEDITSL